MNHPRPTVTLPAAIWLRTCPCQGRMYLVDGPKPQFPANPKVYFCGTCSRLEYEDHREAKPLHATDWHARKLREVA